MIAIKNVDKTGGRSQLRKEKIVGRVVFHHTKILKSHRVNKKLGRRVNFARAIFVDDANPLSQIRVTGFGSNSRHIVNKLKKGGVFSLENFRVKTSTKLFDFLDHKFEISLEDDSIIKTEGEMPSLPRRILPSLTKIGAISSMTVSKCIQIQGILVDCDVHARTITSWTGDEWIIRDIRLMDDTGIIELTLWEEYATDFKEQIGEVFRILGVKILVSKDVKDGQVVDSREATVLRCSDHENDPDDEEGNALKVWHAFDFDSTKPPPTVQVSTYKQRSEGLLKLLRLTRRICSQRKKEGAFSPLTGGKYKESDAIRETGVNQKLFHNYMKNFRKTRPNQPEKYEKALEIYKQQPKGEENPTAVAKSVKLNPGNFLHHLYKKGIVVPKKRQSRGGDFVNAQAAKMIFSGKENILQRDACEKVGQNSKNFITYKHKVGLPVRETSRPGDYTFMETHRQKFLRINPNISQREYCRRVNDQIQKKINCGELDSRIARKLHQSNFSEYARNVNAGVIVPPDVSHLM